MDTYYIRKKFDFFRLYSTISDTDFNEIKRDCKMWRVDSFFLRGYTVPVSGEKKTEYKTVSFWLLLYKGWKYDRYTYTYITGAG